MEKRTLKLKDASIILLLAFLVTQLTVLLGKTIFSAILAIFNYSGSKISNFFAGPWGSLVLNIFQFIAFAGLFVYYYKKVSLKQHCFENKLCTKHTIIYILLGLVSMFCLSYFVNYFCLILNLFNKPSAVFSYAIDSPGVLIITLFSSALLPAVGEELIFRGLIFNGLKEKNTLFAVIVSSLFFALFHFNPSQLLYPFLFGLLLAFAYSKTKNIFVPILIHFINNLTNIILQYFNLTIFKPSTLNIALMAVGTIIFIAILAYMFISNYKQESKQVYIKESKEKQKITNFSMFLKSDAFLFYAPIAFMVFLYIILI